MNWPDPISAVADVVTFIGIPALAFTSYQMWQEIKKVRAERNEIKIVSQDCLEFYDPDQRVGVNLVPLDTIVAIPRVGDTVHLPGETREHQNYGAGLYEITKVEFTYHEAPEVDQPCPAIPSKVIAHVRMIRNYEGRR